MKILVIGASSIIGSSIAKRFAKNNELFLLSTKGEKLETLKNETLGLGSQRVEIIEADLQSPMNIIKLIPMRIDMIINAASATARLKNNEINPHSYQYYTSVDLTSPLIIMEHFLKKIKKGENRQLYYIFINTVLSKIKSPGYSIYYSYKVLQQGYLNNFKREYGDTLKTINVIVGAKIDRNKESLPPINLAKKIQEAIKNNESEFIYGIEGKIIYFFSRISPLLSDSIIYIKRLLLR